LLPLDAQHIRITILKCYKKSRSSQMMFIVSTGWWQHSSYFSIPRARSRSFWKIEHSIV